MQRKELAKPREFRGREEVKALPWTLSSFPGNCTSPKTAEEMERKKEERKKKKGGRRKTTKPQKLAGGPRGSFFLSSSELKSMLSGCWWH